MSAEGASKAAEALLAHVEESRKAMDQAWADYQQGWDGQSTVEQREHLWRCYLRAQHIFVSTLFVLTTTGLMHGLAALRAK
jgi:hypothetical protein